MRKSTLLNIIGGLDNPSRVQVLYKEKDSSLYKDKQLSKFRNEQIGFVFQFFYLQPYLSLIENVEVPLLFSQRDKTDINDGEIIL